ncbi:SpoIIIAH-like family protein [Vallitalea sp.]|jgi:stage III sporulation protein AH|uniref:SpoIIIAH-like family protein n=1 Tax=Vallitalea sp. TaxID=1882829 RepID=UPI0025EA843D|nr:SpoIIIAH-like family protein [Vallitalea sp.]MCT4687070.1 SpoIIIAH-like family protein [Vallitalea sp.]
MQTFKKNQIIITALVIMIAIAGYLQFTENDGTPTQEVLNNQSEEKKKDNVTTSQALVPNGENTNTDAKVEENADNVSKQESSNNIKPEQKQEQKQGENKTTEPTSAVPENDNKDEKKEEAKETSTEKNDSNVGEAILTSGNTLQAGYFLQAKIDREQDYSKLKEGYLLVIDNQNLKDENKVEAVKEMIDLQDRIEKEAAAESILEAKGFKDVFVRMIDDKVDVVINAKELSQADLAKVEDVVRRQTGVDAENIVITLLDVTKAQ